MTVSFRERVLRLGILDGDPRVAVANRALRDLKNEIERANILALRMWRKGMAPEAAFDQFLQKFEEVSTSVMAAGYLYGQDQARSVWRRRVEGQKHLAKTTTYKEAVKFAKARAGMTPVEVKALKARFSKEAVDVRVNVSQKINKELRAAVVGIVTDNVHVKEGMKRMSDAFRTAGVAADSPWIVETLVRTQTNMAYLGGRLEFNADPIIQEELWGYEYTTVGDDRVREEHAELDTMKFPKDDPFWEENMPPNGYNCRCSIIEIWNDEAPTKSDKIPEGSGADEGFEFNPLSVLPKAQVQRVMTEQLGDFTYTGDAASEAEWRKRAVDVTNTMLTDERTAGVRDTLLANPPKSVEFSARAQIAGFSGRPIAGCTGRYTLTTRGIQVAAGTPGEYDLRAKKSTTVARKWDPNADLQLGKFTVFGDKQNAATDFMHEYGHHVDNVTDTPDHARRNEWKSIFQNKSKAEWKRTVSEYGASHPDELFAESFSAYVSPKYKRGMLPPEVEGFMDRHLRDAKPTRTAKAKYEAVKRPQMMKAEPLKKYAVEISTSTYPRGVSYPIDAVSEADARKQAQDLVKIQHLGKFISAEIKGSKKLEPVKSTKEEFSTKQKFTLEFKYTNEYATNKPHSITYTTTSADAAKEMFRKEFKSGYGKLTDFKVTQGEGADKRVVGTEAPSRPPIKRANAWEKKLTAVHRDAFENWADGSYEDLKTPEMFALLKKAPTIAGTVYRGMSVPDKTLAKLTTLGAEVQPAVEGTTKGIASTSTDKGVAAHFGALVENLAGGGGNKVVLQFEGAMTVDISKLTGETYAWEKERLLLAGSKFKVVKVQRERIKPKNPDEPDPVAEFTVVTLKAVKHGK